MIVTENISKSFGKQKVLDDLNLTIEEGKITVIIGKSGAGKSVLLKHLIGLLKPDSGKIIFQDKDITRVSDKELKNIRLNFGVLFQDAALFDSLTVFENVAFPVIEHKLLKDRKKLKELVKETLSLVELENIEDKMPSELSGGMRKRVGLARAIITKPKIIFFDEPTTGLDPITSMSIAKLIKQMQEKLKTTCFIISHDLSLTFKIADRIGFLHNGRIMEFGDRHSIKNSKNPIVIEFLESYYTGEENEQQKS
ncbi:ABC transporter ATP-binding protein [Hippea maritima]|uniref:Sulfate-transporting ATPase n=1 Tax=Hippea maritima (strain ATCC 700847 / DSM 10411 / MH2) TaxID=760142 RepID=F2LU67_HIPMA|nr:ATP-binding cassette domain-containing protein [Hippea maritima]AEA34530.1 Sulfate-transporting ATPase [Hippea maritima DSM 10411]